MIREHTAAELKSLIERVAAGRTAIRGNIQGNITASGITVPDNLNSISSYVQYVVGSLENFLINVCGYSNPPTYFEEAVNEGIRLLEEYKKEGTDDTCLLTEGNKNDFFGNKQLMYVPKLDGNNIPIQNMFNGNTSVREIIEIDLSNNQSTRIDGAFNNCSNIINGDKIIFPDSQIILTNEASNFFSNCTSLKFAPKLNVKFTGRIMSYFNNCKSLVSVDARNYDCSSVTITSGLFSGCTSLVSLIGGDENDVDNGVTTCLNGLHVSTNFSALTSLKKPSFLAVFRGAGDGGGSATFRIPSAIYDDMSDEEKSILTNKHWSLTK